MLLQILLAIGSIFTAVGAWLIVDGTDGFKSTGSKISATTGIITGFVSLGIGLLVLASWYTMGT